MEEKELKQIETKIKKVTKIYNDYQKGQIKNGGSFNICSILRKTNDEVNLHSRFIYELINPDGTHMQKDIFLKLFITEALDIGKNEDDFEFDNLKVEREDLTDDKRKIDFTIKSSNYLIGIEMKIDASDQDKQMFDYYKELQTRNKKNKPKKIIKLYYLTKYGNEPSKKSLCCTLNGKIHCLTDKDYDLLSFSINIERWLKKCIEKTKIVKLQESIKQYLEVIQKITGQLPKEIENKMDKLAENKNDIEILHKIIQDYPRIWAKKEVDFWNELYKRIKKLTIYQELLTNNIELNIDLYGSKDDNYKYEISNDDKINIVRYDRHHNHRCKFGLYIDIIYSKQRFKIQCFKRDDGYSKIDITLYGVKNGINDRKNKYLKQKLKDDLLFSSSGNKDFLINLNFYSKDIKKPTYDLFDKIKFNKYLSEAVKEIKKVLYFIYTNKDDIIK